MTSATHPIALPHPIALQATLLLLEMLDVDKALAALAAEQPIDEAVRWAGGLRSCPRACLCLAVPAPWCSRVSQLQSLRRSHTWHRWHCITFMPPCLSLLCSASCRPTCLPLLR